MKTNRAGIELIKSWEGLRLEAYPDPATGGEPWTIGYGHTSAAGPPKVMPGLKITAQHAADILASDLVKYEVAVINALTRIPNENQLSAMVSLCYNIGPGNFLKSSVRSRFNAGNIALAADAFRLWNKAAGKVMKGLINRREAERQLFLRPVVAVQAAPVPPLPDNPGIDPLPPAVKPATSSATLAKIVGALLVAAIGALVAFVTGIVGN